MTEIDTDTSTGLLLAHSELVKRHLEAFANGDYDLSNKLYSEANLVFERFVSEHEHEARLD